MPLGFSDEQVWEDFVKANQLDGEMEEDFIQYLLEEDVDPESLSRKDLENYFDAYQEELDT